jgi:hypothetical protein
MENMTQQTGFTIGLTELSNGIRLLFQIVNLKK